MMLLFKRKSIFPWLLSCKCSLADCTLVGADLHNHMSYKYVSDTWNPGNASLYMVTT